MTKFITMMAALLLTIGPVGLVAQQRQPMHGGQHRMGPQSQMEGEMGPGMALGQYQPAQLLERRDTLGLTADQVAQLETIVADAQTAHDEAMASHATHREQMMEAVSAERPDPETVQTHFMAAHAAMGMAHWAELDGALKAMRVLTESQRAMVKGWVGGGMQHRHGQGGPGMQHQ